MYCCQIEVLFQIDRFNYETSLTSQINYKHTNLSFFIGTFLLCYPYSYSSQGYGGMIVKS